MTSATVPTIVAVLVLALVTTAIVAALRLERPGAQAVAIARAALQLGLLSLVLDGVIEDGRLVAAFLVLMLVAATWTVRGRAGLDRSGLRTFVVLLTAAGVPLAVVAVTGAVGAEPRYLLGVGRAGFSRRRSRYAACRRYSTSEYARRCTRALRAASSLADRVARAAGVSRSAPPRVDANRASAVSARPLRDESPLAAAGSGRAQGAGGRAEPVPRPLGARTERQRGRPAVGEQQLLHRRTGPSRRDP